ncbi:ribonuclease M5 [Acholeplasma sp. OttesenSCG-928-E16]|nr:ribonuclease M5 [Acholeplasma sp. OttesenSCG-928-E16]
MKNKIYVVEGAHDEAKLKSIYKDIKVISINGSEINEDKVKSLIALKDEFEIVLMLDPDAPGNKIRNTLEKRIGNVKHIYFKKEDAISKNGKKVGIEHIDDQIIKEYLQYEIQNENKKSDLTMAVLYELELVGTPNSKEKRELITDHFHIGKSNSKNLLKKLIWLGINKKELLEVLINE